MILGIQIFGVLFALVMMYITFLHQRRKELNSKEYFFWFGVWVVFLLLVIFPTSLDFLIKDVLSLGRRLDFFIIVGLMLMIGVLFHTYSVVRKTQNKVERVVSKIAVEKREK
ncbi:DUF2304 family protein [Candidatus Woesearchaeota archaeon]|nr:DUF2304 family protein [Candidatus Woesearchaeota archaeon]